MGASSADIPRKRVKESILNPLAMTTNPKASSRLEKIKIRSRASFMIGTSGE